MTGQSRRLSEPLRWGRREKVAVAVVLSCVALALAGLAAFALSSGAPARAGCISLTFASTLGGATVHECGTRARGLCASPEAFHAVAQELRSECRRAGYRFGG